MAWRSCRRSLSDVSVSCRGWLALLLLVSGVLQRRTVTGGPARPSLGVENGVIVYATRPHSAACVVVMHTYVLFWVWERGYRPHSPRPTAHTV